MDGAAQAEEDRRRGHAHHHWPGEDWQGQGQRVVAVGRCWRRVGLPQKRRLRGQGEQHRARRVPAPGHPEVVRVSELLPTQTAPGPLPRPHRHAGGRTEDRVPHPQEYLQSGDGQGHQQRWPQHCHFRRQGRGWAGIGVSPAGRLSGRSFGTPGPAGELAMRWQLRAAEGPSVVRGGLCLCLPRLPADGKCPVGPTSTLGSLDRGMSHSRGSQCRDLGAAARPWSTWRTWRFNPHFSCPCSNQRHSSGLSEAFPAFGAVQASALAPRSPSVK
mmetsp:Transcript_46288/g.143199  ORF Transcript_46288/g.143199 Transcript_46288/m.143199 type:complete len:272 (+) Transcript_46288:561-1376(+)